MRSLLIILLIGLLGNLAQAQDLTARVNADGSPLRLRAGPGLNFETLALLPDGSALTVTGRSEDGDWLEIVSHSQYLTGWVYAEYVAANLLLEDLPINTGQLNFRNLISGIGPESRRIFERGQTLGQHANVFAKVGDSITVSDSFLYGVVDGRLQLDRYVELQDTIDFFDTGPDNAFVRKSVAAGVGWSAGAVLLTDYTDMTQCSPAEMPLRCEYRLIQPAFALIMFGTNDVGYVPLATYRHNMERIVNISIEMAVVPVLSTIPPRLGYEAEVQAYNQILREISQEQQIPLWDYGHAMRVYLPNSLGFDGVHPSLPAHGREDAANFQIENLFAGYVLRNLSALYVLDQLRQDIVLYEDA